MVDLAGIGSVIGAVGGLFGSKGGRPKDKYGNVMHTARGAIDAQKKFGINALELIRGGAGSGPGTQPRVGTSQAIQQTFDAMDDLLTGRSAREEQRQKVQDELAQVELDIQRANLEMLGEKRPLTSPGQTMINEKLATGAGERGPRDPYVDEQILPPDVDLTYPDSIEARPFLEPLVMPDGTVTHVPEDLGQFAMGMVQWPFRRFADRAASSMEEARSQNTQADKQKIRENARRNNPNATDAEIEEIVKSIMGDYY